jgi:hypothetical protein
MNSKSKWVMCSVAVLAMASAGWAGDAWKTKKPSEWSEKEMHKFMTNSPWTRTVQSSMNQMSMDHGPAGTNNGGWGGGPGGGGGWNGGGGNMGGAAPIVSFQVRWASAPMMREALKLSESDALNAAIARYEKDYYVVSVTMHVEGAGSGGGWGHGGGQWGPRGGQGASPEQQEAARKQFEQMLINGALLRVAGHSVHPEKAEMTPSKEGMTTLYMFPRTLKLEDMEKDLVFQLTQGPSVTTANFSFKGMEQAPEKGL